MTHPESGDQMVHDIPSVNLLSMSQFDPPTDRNYLEVVYELLDPRLDAYDQQPKTEASAGFDMRACIPKPMVLEPNKVVLISVGMKFQCPINEMVGFLLPRSGTGHKSGIILGNGTGVIDADYTGEVFMSVWNRSSTPFPIEPMDRLSQLVFLPRLPVTLKKGKVVDDYRRGSAGFGSSGVR